MQHTSNGETALFCVLAPISVLAALGMVFVKKAVHSALMLAVVMICLAMFFAVQSAPFLAVVQVVVYTGAVMMLFLFVLMVVGVDSADSLVKPSAGNAGRRCWPGSGSASWCWPVSATPRSAPSRVWTGPTPAATCRAWPR
jgi:NADH-quinone oxidoreductase subunit J